MRLFLWLIPIAAVAFGVYLLRLSHIAYANYVDYMQLGDPSGAELYDTQMWATSVSGVVLLLFGAFTAGWWSARGVRRP